MATKEQLRELLHQAVEFDLQTVRDADAVRKWRYEAMAAVGGYDVDGQRRADAEHSDFVRRVTAGVRYI